MRLNVLFITYSLDMGGLERVVLDLANGLDPERFEPFICCVSHGGALAADFRKSENLFVLGHQGRPNLHALRKITEFMREHRIDLVHSHNTNGLVFGFFPARRLGLPMVHTMHGHDRDYSQHKLLNLLEGWMSRRVERYVSVSSEVLDQMTHRYRIPAHRTMTLVNGIAVPDEMPESAGASESGFTLGTVGRLVPVKNYGLLLEAFAQLLTEYPNGRLEFAGDGPELDRLQKLADHLGISLSVHFHGMVRGVVPLIRNWDVFLLTSLSEGTSISLLEAMAQGRICIASAVGGNPGVIEHLANGLLFESGNRKDLVDKMTWAIQNLQSEEGGTLRRNAWKCAKTRFSRKGMIRRYSEVYQELVTGRKKRGRSGSHGENE
jgi:glycosyltransferase involved in cell wall biosynthesis